MEVNIGLIATLIYLMEFQREGKGMPEGNSSSIFSDAIGIPIECLFSIPPHPPKCKGHGSLTLAAPYLLLEGLLFGWSHYFRSNDIPLLWSPLFQMKGNLFPSVLNFGPFLKPKVATVKRSLGEHPFLKAHISLFAGGLSLSLLLRWETSVLTYD